MRIDNLENIQSIKKLVFTDAVGVSGFREYAYCFCKSMVAPIGLFYELGPRGNETFVTSFLLAKRALLLYVELI